MLQDNNQNIEITPLELSQLLGDPWPAHALRGAVSNAIDELRSLSHAATSPECDGRSLANALGMLAERLEAASTISSRAARVAS